MNGPVSWANRSETTSASTPKFKRDLSFCLRQKVCGGLSYPSRRPIPHLDYVQNNWQDLRQTELIVLSRKTKSSNKHNRATAAANPIYTYVHIIYMHGFYCFVPATFEHFLCPSVRVFFVYFQDNRRYPCTLFWWYDDFPVSFCVWPLLFSF